MSIRKPLAATLEEGKALVELAKRKGAYAGRAPDTFMGGRHPDLPKLIEDGFIRPPVGAAAFMICRGHELASDPEFYYKHGGGPMMDMGALLSDCDDQSAGRCPRGDRRGEDFLPQRVITSQPKAGTVIDVDVSTYVTGILDFDSGAVGTLFTTFDVVNNGQARFEVYGSEGTLLVPDPNTFGGPVLLLRQEEKEVKEIPLMYDYADNSRGLGLADMAKSLETGRVFRAGYEQTLHVLEVMTAFERSSMARAYVEIESDYPECAGHEA